MFATLRKIVRFFGVSQKNSTTKSINDKNLSQTQRNVFDDSEFDSEDWQTIDRSDINQGDRDESNIERSKRNKLSTTTKMTSRSSEYVVNDDISNGCEIYKIPALSYKRDDKAPSDYHYVTDYVESKPLYIDRSLLNLSNCKCSDEESCNSGYCSCSANYCTGRYYNSRGCLTSDYNFQTPQAIYECNPSCNCNKSYCKNMVIQKGCQLKLVLYKTKSRGWGVRTLEPLRKGTFVGIYSGELITGMDSLKRKDDTYLFNLSTSDIGSNVVNKNKQEEEEEDDNNDLEIVTTENNETTSNLNSKPKDNGQFVCDAKRFGNITRFINHSCEPNVIGIRSFTQHHDQRFPYIAFFTNQDIQADNELTLNYGDNYWLIKCRRDKIFCLCKRSSCRFNKKTFPITFKLYNEQKNKTNISN